MNDQLTRLAAQLAEQGAQPFHAELVALADQVRGWSPGAAQALADLEAPDVVRLRAFALVARRVDGVDPGVLDHVA